MQALHIQHISKRFGILLANDDISLELAQGEILGLLGENGAGKSTLVSILFGHYTADSGHIDIFGKPLPPGDPKAALAAGAGIVHQHFALADNLSVLDNVMLGTEPLWWFATKRIAAQAKLMRVATDFGLDVEPDALVGNLSVGGKQRVEILKALYRGAKLLILDEPTAVLTPQESESLFVTLRQLVAQGMSVIFISHKLAEVLRVSDRVAVLRAGKLVATASANETTEQQLAHWMMGQETDTNTPQQIQPMIPHHAFEKRTVCELHSVNSCLSAREHLRNAHLQLRSGEITAVAGVSGNGQLALADMLCGLLQPTSGHLTLLGKEAPRSSAGFTGAGVARIPEDRKGVGLLGDLPLWENAVSENLRRHFVRWGFVQKKTAKQHAQAIVKRFDVRGDVATGERAVKGLSGGNMQKLLLGRALQRPDGSQALLVVAHQPTWGLDIGAVQFVQKQLVAARNAGAAVLLISDDLDEILALADHVAVIHAGELTPTRPAQAWSRSDIGLAMAGIPEKALHAA